MIRALDSAGMDVVALTPEESKYGAVETREESRRCAELFKKNAGRIDGIIVTLPNFGEERAIADSLRLADLRVPVLIQATPDDPKKMTIAFRRDSFCGKMSACNNLRQYGIPYSITTLHTEAPDSPEFAKDLQWFAAVIDQWMSKTEVQISAVQCWTSLEENFGVVPCTVMSMMSEQLLSSACEVDIAGVLGMHALQLASGTPSALLDWNNNYGKNPDKAVCFHCANLPKHFFRSFKMDFQEIIAGTVGKANTYGTVVGLIKPEKMSFARFSTSDTEGKMRGYVGEGRFTDDALNTFGGAGVVEIPKMQKLLHYICENGFEQHVAANLSSVAPAVHEAATRYLGWE